MRIVEKLLNKLSKNEEKESRKSDYFKPELAHGRQECRYYYMVSNIAEQVDPFGEWKNLKSIGASRLLSF
ncbi:hypothetical protein [Dapis sp. BLCC M229]|uniref:hypothetical protein n=1 Tax=Dapis sp. BLCC M229 TaxID=3400188 RepID=UPI003CED62A3